MRTSRIARLFAAVRREGGLRQLDVAGRAGVSQSTISRIERDQLDRLSLAAIDRVAKALEIDVRLEASWHGGAGDRLVDLEHARLVEIVVAILGRHGWQVLVEYTFNHFGERGSVDVLAYHPGCRALLIVEVKTRLTDLQALLASFGRKVRLVPGLVYRDQGWAVESIGRLLMVDGSTANRSVVERHRASFDSGFPERASTVRRWLARPDRSIGAIWFVAPPRTTADPGRSHRRGA